MGLRDEWVLVDGRPVFFRGSLGEDGAETLVHVHGFALSGSYLLPTARLLADRYTTYVPDLPGFGRSIAGPRAPGIPDLAEALARFLDAVGAPAVTMVGNSMGCPIICEFGRLYPRRLSRAVLVSPAGGRRNRPMARAIGQLAVDGPREPLSLLRVVVPDYARFGVRGSFRLFRDLTRYPTLERLIHLRAPVLAVLGGRDPLLPGPKRVREVVSHMDEQPSLATIPGAAHAINYSHPRELADLIEEFLESRPTETEVLPVVSASLP